MKKFMELVPKGVKISALIVMCGMVVLGSVAGGIFPHWAESGTWHMPWVASLAIGAAGGLAMGAFFAAWMLCLGYVYADARRRAMRPVLWTLIAALFPHLFGFLLYFALRQPMTPRCPKCGQPVTLDQRFCSWCGSPGPVSSGGPEARPDASGWGSVPTA
jgi:MFS family permease